MSEAYKDIPWPDSEALWTNDLRKKDNMVFLQKDTKYNNNLCWTALVISAFSDR